MLTVTDSKTGLEYEVIEVRGVKRGDTFLSHSNSVLTCNHDEMITHIHPILKPIKWRAKEGELFHTVNITHDFAYVSSCIDDRTNYNSAYATGNYYRTSEEAQVAVDKINTMFKENV
tara:strand:- start:134 stop:484 length:351 start_codon:yes stop_codon:yes gene_type:complete